MIIWQSNQFGVYTDCGYQKFTVLHLKYALNSVFMDLRLRGRGVVEF